MRISLSFVPTAIVNLIQRIDSAGGRGLLVGGSVIDIINDREVKDWDIEVFGLDWSQLETLFADLNRRTQPPQLLARYSHTPRLDDVDIQSRSGFRRLH